MMMMMMNCFCGMVNRRKALSLIYSWDHCRRSSPLRISDTPRAGFEPAQNLSSRLAEWSFAVMTPTTTNVLNQAFWKIDYRWKLSTIFKKGPSYIIDLVLNTPLKLPFTVLLFRIKYLHLGWPVSGQCSLSFTPENIRRPLVFWGFQEA